MLATVKYGCVLLIFSQLVACGNSSRSSNSVSFPAGAISYNIPETTDVNASQLLTRASFGPSRTEIDQVMQSGIESWVEQQFTLPVTPQLPYVRQHSNGSNMLARHEIWWQQVITGEDQLRQRMAFALSQIMVISDIGYSLANSQYGVTNYYDLLQEHAFGNFRDLIDAVTRSPIMGLYLSSLQNARGDAATNTRADENYAREVMQLFSIGLHMLNPDGSVKMQGGKPVPAYTQSDVENYARIFTGWNYANADRWDQPLFTGGDLVSPMTADAEYHDIGIKTLIDGSSSTADATAEADLAIALDSLFEHPNVGPFIGKQLIQRLVTSNPTPAYVGRVAAAFDDNGEGVRGDLKALLRAILFDPEAFNGRETVDGFGKLREPLLRMTHLWRAFDIKQGSDSVRGEYNTISPGLSDIDADFGQAPLKSPSVFNFFRPDYSPPGALYQAGVIVPEAEIYTDNNILASTTRINNQIQRFYRQNPDTQQLRWSTIDLQPLLGLIGDSQVLLDELDIVLLSGGMSSELESILLEHLAKFDDEPQAQLAAVRDVLSLIMASPDYLVQM